MYVLYTHTIYTSLPTYLPTYVCEICATSPRPRRAALSCGLRLRFWADPRNRRAWPLRAQRGVPGAGGSAMATGGPWGITHIKTHPFWGKNHPFWWGTMRMIYDWNGM